MDVKVFTSYKPYLLLSLAIGILARFFQLNLQSLWGDELYSVVLSSSKNLSLMYSHLVQDTHPPGYQTLLYFWFKTFGNSEFSARSSSAILGVLVLSAMYHYGKSLLGKYVATSATILAALTYPGIFYSQEVRSYSLLFLLSTVSTLLWLKLLQAHEKSSDGGNKDYYAYALSIILTSYVHYFGLILVFFQLLYHLVLCFYYKRDRLKSLVITSCLGISYAPWVASVLLNNKDIDASVGRTSWLHAPGLFSPFSYFNFLLFDDYLASALAIFFLLILPVALNFKTFMSSLLEKISSIRNVTLPSTALIYLVSATYLFIFLVSQYSPILTHRNLIIIAPAAYLLISLWLNSWLKDYRQNAYTLVVCVIGLALISSNYYTPSKEQWREAVNYTFQRSDNDSIVRALSFEEYFKYYFNLYRAKVSVPRVENKLSSIEKLYEQAKNHEEKKLFLLASPRLTLDKQSNQFLKEHSIWSIEKKFIGITVYEFLFR